MAEIKTKATNASVISFIDAAGSESKRKDARALLALFKEATGEKPRMWGPSMIGFGSYHYKSERSAQEGEWPLTAFSPRKQALTVYVMDGFGEYAPLLKKLGKHKRSAGGCLYINKLDDVDLGVLRQIVRKSFATMKKRAKA